jgi:hypothetical protein
LTYFRAGSEAWPALRVPRLSTVQSCKANAVRSCSAPMLAEWSSPGITAATDWFDHQQAGTRESYPDIFLVSLIQGIDHPFS